MILHKCDVFRVSPFHTYRCHTLSEFLSDWVICAIERNLNYCEVFEFIGICYRSEMSRMMFMQLRLSEKIRRRVLKLEVIRETSSIKIFINMEIPLMMLALK